MPQAEPYAQSGYLAGSLVEYNREPHDMEKTAYLRRLIPKQAHCLVPDLGENPQLCFHLPPLTTTL